MYGVCDYNNRRTIMRVSAISVYNVRPRVLSKRKANEETGTIKQPMNNDTEQSLAFKGHWGKLLGAIAGGTLGFLVGGPAGAVAGAAICGTTCSGYDEPNSPPPSSDNNDIDPGQASGRDSLTGI